jgi:hypothetical protein
MKEISFFTLLFAYLNVNAQVINLPIDSATKAIDYNEVIQVDSVPKEELYSRALEWFAETYKASKSVIQMEDKENGKIVGKALMKVYHRSLGTDYPSGHINYTLSIQFKDGRYRYSFHDFYHSGVGNTIPDYGSCDNMIRTTKKTLGISYQKTFNYYLTQMNGNILNLIQSLKTYMAKSSSLKLKNDW